MIRGRPVTCRSICATTKKAPEFQAGAFRASIVVMVAVVVSRAFDHNPSRIAVVMVVVVVHLSELNLGLSQPVRCPLIDCCQKCSCIQNRLQQVGVGICLGIPSNSSVGSTLRRKHMYSEC